MNVATDSPSSARPPPPKAPGPVQIYSADQSTGIWHYLGDAELKGPDIEGRDSKGRDFKERAQKGKFPKEKAREGKIAKGKAIRAKKRIRAMKKLRLSQEERAPEAIILRIRHGEGCGN